MTLTFLNSWDPLLAPELEKSYFQNLLAFLREEYDTHTVYPAKEDIFAALNVTDYSHVKAVIIGQDPYHGPDQAHGLSFSVQSGVKIPPSLRNIFKELRDDLGFDIPHSGDLTPWAHQGVLLLNTVLTVRAGQAHSHKNQGWERFTDHIISLLNDSNRPIVFILWGRHAQLKAQLITGSHHHILSSAHPSPLSARKGFFGSRPFSKTNELLVKDGRNPINWEIENI